MTKRVFAVASHPDDIEFVMSGTLILLKKAGYEIHYMNVANGSCGTTKYDRCTIIEIRRKEAKMAAESIGAFFHDSLVNDLEVFYERDTLFRLGAVIREVAPEIVLTHYPFEYMEDHSNTCRLTVSAAFCRSMINFPTIPETKTIEQSVTLYHCLPFGLLDPLRRTILADVYVDVSEVIEQKKEMLAKHKSQKEWLDISQGMDSYLHSMVDLCGKVGKFSHKYEYAEGWIRHLHQGFCASDADPLFEALKECSCREERSEKNQ